MSQMVGAASDPAVDSATIYTVHEAKIEMNLNPPVWAELFTLTLRFEGGTELRLFICPKIAQDVFGWASEKGREFLEANWLTFGETEFGSTDLEELIETP